MQFAGIQPTLESSTLFVEVYRQAGDPDQARVHFDQMMKSGHSPDNRCTASVMTAYARRTLLDKVLDLLLTLKKKDGFKPGVGTNDVLVDWLRKLQPVEEAERVLEEIKAMGDTPFVILASLCDMYARGNEEKAEVFEDLDGGKKLLKADQFERIVSGRVGGEMVNEVKRMYDSMQSLGFSTLEPVTVALMAALSRSRHKLGMRM